MPTPLVMLALCVCAGSLLAAERVFDFGEHRPGETPRGFRSALTGTGPLGEWTIVPDEAPSLLPPISPNASNVNKRPVLAQVSRDRTDERFPLLIFDEDTYGDFTFTARFKLVDGVAERMAGLAFRIQDERNYYYIRASGLGNSFYFLKLVDGIRSPPIGNKIEIPSGSWHELTVECRGNQIRGLLNGKEVIPTLADKSFTSGKIGFWTKSDSVSYFTDARLVYTPREILAQTLVRDALKENPRLKGLKIFAANGRGPEPELIASSQSQEVGQPAGDAEKDVIASGRIYHGRTRDTIMVTMPLHDNNGEAVAAVQVIMKPFPGQTEKNAMARAMPIVKQMESRVQTAKDLIQ